jgi:hypothetical protein
MISYNQIERFISTQGWASAESELCLSLPLTDGCWNPFINLAIPVAVRSKAWFCGRCLAGIVGFNAAEGMVVCLV